MASLLTTMLTWFLFLYYKHSVSDTIALTYILRKKVIREHKERRKEHKVNIGNCFLYLASQTVPLVGRGGGVKGLQLCTQGRKSSVKIKKIALKQDSKVKP